MALLFFCSYLGLQGYVLGIPKTAPDGSLLHSRLEMSRITLTFAVNN